MTRRAVGEVAGLAATIQDTLGVARSTYDPLIFGAARGGAARAKVLGQVRSEAVAAERLLVDIVETQPGLAPVLDAVRGVRAIQAMHRPTNGPIHDVAESMRRATRMLDAWTHVQPLDRDARLAAAARLRGMEPKDFSIDDWRTLAGILGDDVDGSITAGVPRHPAGVGQGYGLQDTALLAAHEPATFKNADSPFFLGRQHLDAWRESTSPLAERRARMDEFFTMDPNDLTRAQWRELNGLAHVGDHGIDEHAWFPGMRFSSATRSAMLSGYERARSFAERPYLTSASPALIAQARSELLASGDLGDLARTVLQRGELGQLGIAGKDAAAVRLRHLVPTSPTEASAWLDDVRAALDTATVEGPAADLRRTAVELIDRNEARIAGERWYVFRDGYSNHPDYAELGRVRSIYQLLERVGAIEVHPAMRPAPPAPAPVNVTTDGARGLTW